jgi:hypothetical protein
MSPTRRHPPVRRRFLLAGLLAMTSSTCGGRSDLGMGARGTIGGGAGTTSASASGAGGTTGTGGCVPLGASCQFFELPCCAGDCQNDVCTCRYMGYYYQATADCCAGNVCMNGVCGG